MPYHPDAVKRLKAWARRIRQELVTLYLATLDPGTPWYARVLALAVIAYAVSPIDLIPDFIPVLGYLDDLILVPLGLLLVRRLIPVDVLERCRSRAAAEPAPRIPGGLLAAVAIVLVWLAVAFTMWTQVSSGA